MNYLTQWNGKLQSACICLDGPDTNAQLDSSMQAALLLASCECGIECYF
jgi:hypothetical protein